MTDGAQAPVGKVVLFDGVGMLRRGDVCLIVYQKAARVERTRWLFDTVEGFLATTTSDLLALMIVLPTADPPDDRTRRENLARMRKISDRVRRLVTVPIGNTFKVSVVRTVMRSLNTLLGYSDTQFITDTVEEGISELMEVKSAETPTAEQILADLGAIYVALGEPAPRFPKVRPGHGPSTPP